MADKPIPSGPSAAQLALVKKYLANAGWSESDLEELFAPETGTPRITSIPDSEAKAIQDQYQPKTQQGYAAGGLIAMLADEAASGRGFYDSGISAIISEAISKGEGLNPDIKDAAGYKKIYEDFVAEQIATKAALNAANLKYAPIESRKGLPSRDERYSLVAPDGTLDTAAVDYFFPSMNKNLAAYKAKNPLVSRPDSEVMRTVSVTPTAAKSNVNAATLIKTLQDSLEAGPSSDGTYTVNGVPVNGFQVKDLLVSLRKGTKALPKIKGRATTNIADEVGFAEQNLEFVKNQYGPTGATPNEEIYQGAIDRLKAAMVPGQQPKLAEGYGKSVADVTDANNLAALSILSKAATPLSKSFLSADSSVPAGPSTQQRLTQTGGQGQSNRNPTYQWQNALAIQAAKDRLAASGRTPFMDVLFNMAKSGAANKSTK